MAGLLMKPGDYDHGLGPLSINTIKEFRGRSYLTGGDRGASTVANFIKYYNSAVQGLSHGSHLIEFCQGNKLFIFSVNLLRILTSIGMHCINTC